MESNSGIMFAAINSEDDSAKIEDINRRVTQLLDSFSVSQIEGFVIPHLTCCIYSWRIISRAPFSSSI